MPEPTINPLVYEIVQAIRDGRHGEAVAMAADLEEQVGAVDAILQTAATGNALHRADYEVPLSHLAELMAEEDLEEDAPQETAVDPDDELERALDVPVTGREAGLWMVDLIESVVANGPTPTEESRLIVQRLAELGQPEVCYQTFAVVAGQLFELVKQQMDLLQTDAEESGRRALLGVRWTLNSKGQQQRNPFSHSSEG